MRLSSTKMISTTKTLRATHRSERKPQKMTSTTKALRATHRQKQRSKMWK